MYIEVLEYDRSCSPGKLIDWLFNSNSIKWGFAEWCDQFKSAFFVNGSIEEQREAGKLDWVIHIFTFPWKVLYSFVPPPAFFGGYLCFVVCIFCIGMNTAFISDVAEMFGCVLDVPDVVTAISFVALGTSMPDLFASLHAAVQDPNADASIVNVTG